MRGIESTCFCILGMHRSGTSCLAGILENAGVANPRASKFNIDNLKGNRENQELFKINVELLKTHSATWKSLKVISKGGPELNDKAGEEIEKLTRYKYWLFKEPRTLLTLEFWKNHLPNTIFFGTFRDPIKVAISLWERDGLPILNGLELWLFYNKTLLEFCNKNKCFLFNFDLKPNAYKNQFIGLSEKLGVVLDFNKGLEFFEQKLIHQTLTYAGFPSTDPSSNLLLQQVNLVYQSLRKLASSEIKLGKPDKYISLSETTDELQKLLKIQPTNYFVHQQISNIYLKSQKLDLAIEHLKESINLHPGGLWSYQKLIDIYLDRNQVVEGLSWLEKARKLHPLQVNLGIRLAKTYVQMGRLEQGVAVLKKELETQEIQPLYLALYHIYRSQDDYELAFETILEIQKKNIQFDLIDFHLGLCSFKLGNYEQALDYFSSGKSMAKSELVKSRYAFQSGNVYGKMEDFEKAKECYKKVTLDAKMKSLALHRLAVIANKEGQHEDAISLCTEIIALDQSFINAYLLRANLFIRGNELILAENDVKFAEQLNLKNAQIQVRLGNLFFKLKKYELAKSCFEKALNLNPSETMKIKLKMEMINNEMGKAKNA